MDATLDAGGRVTRSLRKRLNSVDSNTTSRPGTPVPPKLSPVTEMDCSAKPRMRRRNSTTDSWTPVKTSAKLAGGSDAEMTSENANLKTPTRRSSRKLNVSSTEGESSAQNAAKKPLSVLLEEEMARSFTRKRVTESRSVSKSPNQSNEVPGQAKTPRPRGRKPGPKSKTRRVSEDVECTEFSDVEIINLDTKNDINKKERDDLKSVVKTETKIKLDDGELEEKVQKPIKDAGKVQSPSIGVVDMNEENIMKHIDEVIHIIDTEITADEEFEKELMANTSAESKTSKEPVSVRLRKLSNENASSGDGKNMKQAKVGMEEVLLGEILNKSVEKGKEDLSVKNGKVTDPLEAEPNDQVVGVDGDPEVVEAQRDVDIPENNELTPNNSSDEIVEQSSVNTDSEQKTAPTTPQRESSVLVTEVVNIGKLPSDTIAELINPISSATKGSGPLKNVAFNESANEDVDKEVYPKTPGLTKSKSYIEMDSREEQSFHADKESNRFEDTTDAVDSETQQDGDMEKSRESAELQGIAVELIENKGESKGVMESQGTMTPPPVSRKSKLLRNIQSSTPIFDGISGKNPTESKRSIEKSGNDNQNLDKSLQSAEKDDDSSSKSNGITSEENIKSISNEMSSSLKDSSSKNCIKEPATAVLDEGIISSSIKISKVESKENGVRETEEAKKSVLKWTQPSVRGKSTDGQKLDAITSLTVSDEDIPKKISESVEKEQTSVEKKNEEKKGINESVIGRKDELMNDDDDEDEDEDERAYRPEHDFLEDEAMEVDHDYQSGDSMNSEERLEIAENEIPIDGESIGSHTTDDGDEEACDEEDDDSKNDSFIVSDSGDNILLEYSDDNEHLYDSAKGSQNSHKRVNVIESSSESDTLDTTPNSDCISEENICGDKEEEREPIERGNRNLSGISSERNCRSLNGVEKAGEFMQNQKRNSKALNSSSDSSKLLTSCKVSKTDVADSSEEENVSMSRKHILRKLNQSDYFNKSVRELDPDKDISSECTKVENGSHNTSIEGFEVQEQSSIESCTEGKKSSLKRVKQLRKSSSKAVDSSTDEEVDSGGSRALREDSNNDSKKEKNTNKDSNIKSRTSLDHKGEIKGELRQEVESMESMESMEEGEVKKDKKTQPTDFRDNNRKGKTSDEGKESVSCLGEVSTTTDESEESENVPKRKRPKVAGLSVSFGNRKPRSKDALDNKVVHRSFTIGVSVTGNEVITKANEGFGKKDGSQPDTVVQTKIIATPSTCPPDLEKGQMLSSDDVQQLEKVKHIPLGNPLVRTRRQSLALPANPYTEINSTLSGKKNKRKSLGLLSGDDWKPSQSFIDSVELQKSEKCEKQSSKRKRLSKSFCGATASLDNTNTDIDVRHLHKRSRLGEDSDLVDCQDSIDEVVDAPTKITHSSTPCGKSTNDGNNNIQHIIERCDEILESANRAKLEARIASKNKGKLAKKLKKSEEWSVERTAANQDQDKTKLAVAQALKASANILMGKKKDKYPTNIEQRHSESKRLPLEILDAIAESENEMASNQKHGKDLHSDSQKDRHPHRHPHRDMKTKFTSAGSITEAAATPEKKKRITKIQLPTGTMRIEPLTPRKKSVLSCKGIDFRESPVTPRSTGFKVRRILAGGQDTPPTPLPSGARKGRKRKRNFDEPQHTLPKPRWTQSGFFFEEDLPMTRQVERVGATKFLVGSLEGVHKRKKPSGSHASALNFKENALFRSGAKRVSAREILQRKERRLVHNRY